MKVRDIFKKAKSAKSRNKSYTTDSTQEVKVKRAFNITMIFIHFLPFFLNQIFFIFEN